MKPTGYEHTPDGELDHLVALRLRALKLGQRDLLLLRREQKRRKKGRQEHFEVGGRDE